MAQSGMEFMPVSWYVSIVYDNTYAPVEQDELDHVFKLSFLLSRLYI